MTMTIFSTPAWWRVATIRWAMEMEPMFSMGLKSPILEDMPAATIRAPVCICPPPCVALAVYGQGRFYFI